jgi:hypothetical protein
MLLEILRCFDGIVLKFHVPLFHMGKALQAYTPSHITAHTSTIRKHFPYF